MGRPQLRPAETQGVGPRRLRRPAALVGRHHQRGLPTGVRRHLCSARAARLTLPEEAPGDGWGAPAEPSGIRLAAEEDEEYPPAAAPGDSWARYAQASSSSGPAQALCWASHQYTPVERLHAETPAPKHPAPRVGLRRGQGNALGSWRARVGFTGVRAAIAGRAGASAWRLPSRLGVRPSRTAPAPGLQPR